MFKKGPKLTSYILLVAITISGFSTFMGGVIGCKQFVW